MSEPKEGKFITGTERIAVKLANLASAIDALENLADLIVDGKGLREDEANCPPTWPLASMIENLPDLLYKHTEKLYEIEDRIAKSLQLRE